ncbi:MAG: DUF6445 family protein [Pseudomonadota bacterium]
MSESTPVQIGAEQTQIVQVSEFFKTPELVVEVASSHRYAHINPHYPGIRASVEPALLAGLCEAVSELDAAGSGGGEAGLDGAGLVFDRHAPERASDTNTKTAAF